MWKQVSKPLNYTPISVYFNCVLFFYFLFFFCTDTTHLPIKPLMDAKSMPFDQEAKCFFDQLELMGFNIEAWTKAPYLCEGDLRQSFYWLVDVVVVLSKK